MIIATHEFYGHNLAIPARPRRNSRGKFAPGNQKPMSLSMFNKVTTSGIKTTQLARLLHIIRQLDEGTRLPALSKRFKFRLADDTIGVYGHLFNGHEAGHDVSLSIHYNPDRSEIVVTRWVSQSHDGGVSKIGVLYILTGEIAEFLA